MAQDFGAALAANQSHPLLREGGRGDGRSYGADDDDRRQPVIIIGGGPVGMALGMALHQQGIAGEIHDARARGAAANDQRVLALSHGSQQILNALGVWPQIRATAITDIHVSQRDGLGRTRIRASDEGVAALGYVASAASIVAALDQALQEAGVAYVGESRLVSATASEGAVTLECSDGATTAQLVAYAEGRIDSSEAVVEKDYGQHALICRVTPQEAHQGRAWERFTTHGPFALLPHENDYAAVYTCTPAEAERLQGLSDIELLAHLQSEFGARVQFNAIGQRAVFPLGLRYRQTPVAARQVWLGNAAQTLHPVAGQGFNLALRDVMALTQTIAGAADPGAAELLSRYAAGRRLDRRGTIGITHNLIGIFSNNNPLLRHARGAALVALDVFPPLRSFLARRMMYGARAW